MPGSVQNFRTIISLGGAVSPTLPGSVKSANQSLNKLKISQAGLKKDSTALNKEIIALTKAQKAAAPGTAEHTQATQALEVAQQRLEKITPQIRANAEEIKRLYAEQSKATTATNKLRQAFKSSGLVFAAITGLAVGLGFTLSRTAQKFIQLRNSVLSSQINLQEFQRVANQTGAVLGDLDAGKQFAASLGDLQQSLRLAKQGLEQLDTRTAAIAGFDPYQLDDSSPEKFKQQITEIYRRGNKAQRDAFARYFGQDITQGIAAEEDLRLRGIEVPEIPLLPQKTQDSYVKFGITMSYVGGMLKRTAEIAQAAFLPAFQKAADILLPILTRVGNFIENNEKLIGVLGLLTFAGIAVVGTLAGLNIAIAITKFAFSGLAKTLIFSVGKAIFGTVIPAIFSLAGTMLTTAVPAAIAMGGAMWAAVAPLLPIILPVVAAVGLLAGAGYLIYKNWDKIKSFFGNLFGFMKDNWRTVLAAVFPFIGIPLLIIKNWGKIKAFFGNLIGSVVDFFGSGIDKIKGFFTGLGEGVKNLFMNAFDFVKDIFLDRLKDLIALYNKTLGKLTGEISIDALVTEDSTNKKRKYNDDGDDPVRRLPPPPPPPPGAVGMSDPLRKDVMPTEVMKYRDPGIIREQVYNNTAYNYQQTSMDNSEAYSYSRSNQEDNRRYDSRSEDNRRYDSRSAQTNNQETNQDNRRSSVDNRRSTSRQSTVTNNREINQDNRRSSEDNRRSETTNQTDRSSATTIDQSRSTTSITYKNDIKIEGVENPEKAAREVIKQLEQKESTTTKRRNR